MFLLTPTAAEVFGMICKCNAWTTNNEMYEFIHELGEYQTAAARLMSDDHFPVCSPDVVKIAIRRGYKIPRRVLEIVS
jgi:hypothetical protein